MSSQLNSKRTQLNGSESNSMLKHDLMYYQSYLFIVNLVVIRSLQVMVGRPKSLWLY
jgi:hypothetical protein